MKVFKTISSAILITLVMISSTSFMVSMHICGGEIQNVALFTKADGCEKEKQLPPCHRHETPACCQNETVVHEGDDVQYTAINGHVPAPNFIDIEQPFIILAEIIPAEVTQHYPYFNYDPPFRACDLTVEHRVFLI